MILKPTRRIVVRVMALALAVALAQATVTNAQESRPSPVELKDVPWRPSGPGREFAILDGDPSLPGQPFTMLLRLADGAWIQPHTHNIAKRILVVSGTLRVGHGAVLDSTNVQPLNAGGFILIPAEHAHFEGARGPTIVAMYGVGPFRTTFLPRPE